MPQSSGSDGASEQWPWEAFAFSGIETFQCLPDQVYHWIAIQTRTWRQTGGRTAGPGGAIVEKLDQVIEQTAVYASSERYYLSSASHTGAYWPLRKI